MGFIYGIVSKTDLADSADFKNLEQAMLYEDFISSIILEDKFSLGICWNPKRNPNAYAYSNTSYAIVADIKLYNTEELRKQFDFENPAQAFIKAYEKWGEACGNHLNGDYSAVLIDKIHNNTFLFRDHIGCRPLTYTVDGDRLIFASHEFGLAKAGITRLDASKGTAFDRIFEIKGNYKKTVFKGIYKLTPGHWGKLTKNGVTEYRYWKPEHIRTDKSLTFEASVSSIREKLIAATLQRIDSGKVGSHVSGGLDSTGIACILADYLDTKERLIGYSWTPSYSTPINDEVKQLDETPFINDFIKDKKIPVRLLEEPSIEQYLQDATQFDFEVQHIEQPTMRQAAKDNISILFSGWGGDELVSFPNRGILSHLLFKGLWLHLLRFIKTFGIKSFIATLRYEILPLLIPFGLLRVYQPFPWKRGQFLHLTFRMQIKRICHFLKSDSIISIKGRKGIAIKLLTFYHMPKRMDSWAINAEKYGFEYRYPLLDKELLELWFSIPQEHTFHNFESRILYREALKGILTESIRTRKEKGELLRISDTFDKIEKTVPLIYKQIKNREADLLNVIFNHDRFVQKVTNAISTKNKDLMYIAHTQKVLICYLRYINLYSEYLTNTRKQECELETL
jgi:asparagine synthase (glutamine-hydrolysing)